MQSNALVGRVSRDCGIGSLGIVTRMKTKWGILLVLLAVAGLVAIFWPPAIGGKSPVNVMFLAATNDATGAKWMVFCATNGTKRLFVRGRSEIELQATPSNQTTTVQITNVDYLKPGQSATFSMRSPASGQSWRLNFTYLGQFGRLESLKYETGWFLYRRGFRIPVNRLPSYDVREITTQWINE